MFELLLVSPPEFGPREPEVLSQLFEAGLNTFHLRKPQASPAEVAAYLRAIPARYHGRVMLHQHHALAQHYAVKGLHLTAAARQHWSGKREPGQSLSTSFHSLAEVSRHRRRYDYVFLSPVFTSISKAGYPAAFEWAALQAALRSWTARPKHQPRVMALGGVEAGTIGQVRRAGFAGAAVLGAVWQQPDPVAAFRALQVAATQAE